MDLLGPVTGVIGVITLIVGCVVALSNRSVRQERIEHLEGRVDALREELDDERATSAVKIRELQDRVSRAEGQVESLTGELGERIGSSIAKAVLKHLMDDGTVVLRERR